MMIVNSLDEKVWREFVAQHPQGNIFHTPEMFQVFECTKGYQPKLWAAVSDNDQLQALFLPVLVTLRDGIMRKLTTRSIAYGGVLCAPDSRGKEALALLLSKYNEVICHDALFTELRHLSDPCVIRPVLEQCGFAYENHLNYTIDLNSSPEQLLQNIGPRTRKHIRREIKKGRLSVEQVTNRNQIKTCYGLIKRSYIAANVPIADLSLFEAAFDVLSPRNMVKFWLVRKEDFYIAASVELIYKDIIYGWYGGVDRTYSTCTPSELLTYHILKWGIENGFHIYDFGGAGTPDEEYGVRDFKAKFGGQMVNFGRNTLIHSPVLLRISEKGYQVYRHLTG